MKVKIDVIKPRGCNRTTIEWADYSANPIRAVSVDGQVGWACRKVSVGCANCYAESMNLRFGSRVPFTAAGVNEQAITMDWGVILQMLRMKPRADARAWLPKAPDAVPKVFIGDMCDVFLGDDADGAAGAVHGVPDWMIDVLCVVCHYRSEIDWLWLTKRIGRARRYFEVGLSQAAVRSAVALIVDKLPGLLSKDEIGRLGRLEQEPESIGRRLWIGTSVESQTVADVRIPELLRIDAAVRFLSMEPLLERVDIGLDAWWHPAYDGTRPASAIDGAKRTADLIRWVIVGGESGAGARGTHVEDIKHVVRQCDQTGVPVFLKQLGSRPCDVNYGDPSLPGVPFGFDDGGEEVERWYKPRDAKGGDMADWPEHLRRRAWPLVSRV